MKIGIIGLGLIGGSLAKSFRKNNSSTKIIAFDINKKHLEIALEENILDEYTTTIDDSFKACNVIFLCTPVDTIVSFAKELAPFIDEDCILTDVGSTKVNIVEKMNELSNINFIGGHPMAGSEKNGYEHSKNYLFENAYYIFTPEVNFNSEHTNLLKSLVMSIGAIPIFLSPKEHDHTVAAISHLPHVIASALVNSVSKLDNDTKSMHLLAAGGFKDITRIASADPYIWSSISNENKEELFFVLNIFINELNYFKDSLNNKKQYDFFNDAKKYRDSFITTNKTGYYTHFEIKVDAIDKPGSIATIATMLCVNGINIKNIGIINNREFESGVMSISFDNQEDLDKSITLLKSMNYFVYE